jgi:dihydropyrimidinase
LKRPPSASYFEAARVANKLKEPHPVNRAETA